MVEENLNTRFDGRNMKVNSIQDEGVRLLSKILGYKFNHGSRLDLVLARFLHVAYIMAMKGENVNLCDIIQTQLFDNIAMLKKSKSTIFRFESLLTHIFFYVARKFPSISSWDGSECTMQIVTQSYRSKLDIVRDNDIDRMMKSFQTKMK